MLHVTFLVMLVIIQDSTFNCEIYMSNDWNNRKYKSLDGLPSENKYITLQQFLMHRRMCISYENRVNLIFLSFGSIRTLRETTYTNFQLSNMLPQKLLLRIRMLFRLWTLITDINCIFIILYKFKTFWLK